PRRRRATTPVVAKSTPVVAKPAPVVAQPAPVVAQPVPAPVQATTPAPVQPVVVTPDGGEDAAGTAGEGAGAPQVPATTPAVENQRTPNSGILLLVIGLIGVGLLAVILRTPREATPTSIIQPQAAPPVEPEVKAPVEPIRRPGDSPKPRATGSHG
ncbi:MAG TPA: hypothetical protein VF787_09975, partial [Thermoanaerobaculia bacterium]